MMENSIKGLRNQLREGIFPWALLPYITAGLFLIMFDPENAGLVSWNTLGMLISIFAALVCIVRQRYSVTAAWLLSIGSLLVTTLAWHWYPESDPYHALVVPVVGAALMLGPLASVVIAGLATAILGLGMLSAATLYRGPAVFATNASVLWGTAFLMGLAQRPLNTMVTWMWSAYEQARENLESARDRQLELKHALGDLDLAHREVMRLNDLLTAARAAIESARKAKEEFVANVSHELRTPLNMIIGFSDEILERPEVYSAQLPAELLSDVAAIKRNSEHLAALVDDVLELAEADAGYTHLAREEVSVREIIFEAKEAISGFFERKGLTLTVSIPWDLPHAYCDPVRIRQVVLNLLSNAARFTEEGGARVVAEEENGAIAISVADTGAGVESGVLSGLFEPFQQADPSVRREYGGTGLGLAISKRFVEMHGGHITIESEIGRGTTVSFTLPLQPDLPYESPKRWFSPFHQYDPRTRPSMAPQTHYKPRIMVVEQGHALSDLMRRCQDTLEVTSVQTVERAREMTQTQPPIALVINEMPPALSVSPVDLARNAFDIPILHCWVPEKQMEITPMGVHDHLIKPIRRHVLHDSIKLIAPGARRVLVVDDDDEARQLFRRMLSDPNAGYDLAEAADGETALILMREWKPDLVLLDLIMPGVDGFVMLEEKARDDAMREIPVVVISARDPQREPIMSRTLLLTRQNGLSARDLALAIEALVSALPPRFGAPEQRGTPAPLPASE